VVESETRFVEPNLQRARLEGDLDTATSQHQRSFLIPIAHFVSPR
jgi:hypothetical protein